MYVQVRGMLLWLLLILSQTGTKWGIPEIYTQATAWVKQAHSMCGEP